MKVGDILTVRDFSGAKALREGVLQPGGYGCPKDRQWRIVATEGSYPTTPDVMTEQPRIHQNDTMAVACDDPGLILFTKEQWCRAVPSDTAEVTVPLGTRKIVVTIS